MKLAVQEHLLAGADPLETLTRARSLGLDGVEFPLTDDFSTRIEAIAQAVTQTGVRVSALNAGHTRLIHPDYAQREVELARLREAMAMAVDLDAQGVIFMGHYDSRPVLPDLFPYKSSSELEAELLVTMLRTTLCDHALAMGTELLLAPANQTETHLVRRVSHAALVREKLNTPNELKICASTYHMAMENEDLGETLAAHGNEIGYLHISADAATDFTAIITALREAGYDGWLCIDRLNQPDLQTPVNIIRSAMSD